MLLKVSSKNRRLSVSVGAVLKDRFFPQGDDPMKFHTQQHSFCCGNVLRARTIYVCILSAAGTTVIERKIPTNTERLLKLITPYRQKVDDRCGVYVLMVLACRSVCPDLHPASRLRTRNSAISIVAAPVFNCDKNSDNWWSVLWCLSTRQNRDAGPLTRPRSPF